MTSIISPWAYASKLATQAQDRLVQASQIVRSGDAPLPLGAGPIGRIGIPEENGPDSPDNPWFVSPDPVMPPQTRNDAALRLAGGAVTAIDQALGLGNQLSSGVTLAFQRAKQDALSGVQMLQSDPNLPIAPGQSALQFDSASMWLGLAKNLLTLDSGQHVAPPVVVRPPVTTLPLPAPAPGEPGSPITIKPIDVPVSTMPIEEPIDVPASTMPIEEPIDVPASTMPIEA